MLSTEAKQRLEELRENYPNVRSALLPALHVAQEDRGWLSPEVMAEVAEQFGVSPSEVQGVASFYTMYRERPLGKYLLQVCTNISCGLMGARHIVDHLSEKLGIQKGETTPDGKFTLMTVECLGACGSAPVMQVNEDFYEYLTPEKVDEILAALD